MQHKGYLDRNGRVRPNRSDQTVGEIIYHEKRYNLRRVYVERTWTVTLTNGFQATGETRKDAVSSAYQHYLDNLHNQE